MHQQPPQTPLCFATDAAKSGHVVSSSGFTPKSVKVKLSHRFPHVTQCAGSQGREWTLLHPGVEVRASSIAGRGLFPTVRLEHAVQLWRIVLSRIGQRLRLPHNRSRPARGHVAFCHDRGSPVADDFVPTAGCLHDRVRQRVRTPAAADLAARPAQSGSIAAQERTVVPSDQNRPNDERYMITLDLGPPVFG